MPSHPARSDRSSQETLFCTHRQCQTAIQPEKPGGQGSDPGQCHQGRAGVAREPQGREGSVGDRLAQMSNWTMMRKTCLLFWKGKLVYYWEEILMGMVLGIINKAGRSTNIKINTAVTVTLNKLKLLPSQTLLFSWNQTISWRDLLSLTVLTLKNKMWRTPLAGRALRKAPWNTLPEISPAESQIPHQVYHQWQNGSPSIQLNRLPILITLEKVQVPSGAHRESMPCMEAPGDRVSFTTRYRIAMVMLHPSTLLVAEAQSPLQTPSLQLQRKS